MKLLESGQMYLETILVLSKKMSAVRAIDISEYMNYSKPSVSRAMGLLKNGGLINIDSKGYITLTDDGIIHAQKIYERHNVLTKMLEHIGVDKETALNDACKIEHVISDNTFNALKEFISKIEN
ncbi:MAG: metal-dependent transcriptional regulator [Clostridia bacterium]|nr:metal-dependent transcriptional regulator [Clostridia bacterium]